MLEISLFHLSFFVIPTCMLALDVDLSREDLKVWTTCNVSDVNNSWTGETCWCGNDIYNAIQCEADSIMIQPCYCMYYEASENRTIAGNCMMTCFNTGHKSFRSITRYSVQNGSRFNNDMCSKVMNLIDTHREGRFCGRCKKDYGLAAYSYHYTSCIPCKHYNYKNWLRYFAIALLPLTVFYFVVVLLKINVFSSKLCGSVFVLQCAMSPVQLRVFDGWIYGAERSTLSIGFKLLNLLMSILGIVNLDFFRTVYPYVCLHPKLNILHVVSLDFIVALYPFFLIFLTYLLVTLYDRNNCLVVWAWKPFKCCLQRYQRQFDMKGSLVETFATFILLSNVKIIGVCFDILVPTRAYNETGSSLNTRFLYHDANIEYFGSEHLPFAVLALLIGFVFAFLPFIVLLLYPCSCFQKILNAFGCRSHVLHIFMDGIQGCYKTQPHDMRLFSAYYLLLRFVVLFTMSSVESVFLIPFIAFIVIVGGLVFAIFQPYQRSQHNKLDIITLFIMALFYTGLAANQIASTLDQHWFVTSRVLIGFSIIILAIGILTPIIFFSVLFKKVWSVCIRKMQIQRHDSYTSLLTETRENEEQKSLVAVSDN